MATSIGQVAQELTRLNPWWRDPDWHRIDPDLHEVEDTQLHYQSSVLDDLHPGSLYILRGPRRVGKTVAVKQKIKELIDAGTSPRTIVRVAADGWSAKDIRTLVQNVALPPIPDGEQRTWFLDEISAVTGDWAQQIKWLRDNDPEFRRATVVLTGSNATELTGASGALAGRRGRGERLDRALLPIGFRTFANLLLRNDAPQHASLPLTHLYGERAATTYASLIPWLDLLVEAWELYLMYGGFPRAVAAAIAGEPIPTDFVEDLFHVVSADAFKSSQLAAHTEQALLDRLWQGMASPANLSTIAQDTSTTVPTVSRHIGYLRDSFLLWNCAQKSDEGWLPRAKAQPKLYAVDPLLARMAHLRNPARRDIDPTVLAEMQIGMAIRRRVLFERPSAENDEFLFFWRTPTRKEIDFVSEDLAGAAVEGKYTEGGSWASEAQTVNASVWDGVLVTRNVIDTPAGTAWAIPAGVLAYLLDT